MADLETGRPDEGARSRSTATILVCAPDDGRRTRMSDQLTGAGFRVLATRSWSGAQDLLADNDVHLGVVDSAVSDYRPDLLHAQDAPTYWSDQTAETPLIFLVDDPLRFDWDTYAGLDRAEILSHSAVPDMLVPQVCALVRWLDRQGEQRQAETRLRAAVRDISTGLQTNDESRVLIERLVVGIGAAFDADLVSFMALDNAPVTGFAVQWDASSGGFEPFDIARYGAPLHALAEVLWAGGIALQVASHESSTPPPALAELFTWAASMGIASSITIPVGDANAPFGLLWLASRRSRRWSPLEVSMLELLAGRLSRGMLQAQVFADQREVLRRLAKLDRAKSDFLATVNHELRTPLTTMTAYLDLLRDGAGGPLPDRATEMVSIIDRNASRLGSLVNDILTVSRMAANDVEVTWAEVDVSRLARQVVNQVRPAAAARGVELVTELTPSLLVDGDARQLEQVLAELADNAVKFTGSGGRVEFEVTEDGSENPPTVQVCVSDTGTGIGAGISEDEMPDLFTSFYRGAHAQATAVAGSGLGLAIVSGLVAAHDGTVDVTTTETGGTRVRIHLPKTRRDRRPYDVDGPAAAGQPR